MVDSAVDYSKLESDVADSSTRRMLRGTWWEIPRHALAFGEELGSGMFGQVVKGWVRLESGESQRCAVKMLKGETAEKMRVGSGG